MPAAQTPITFLNIPNGEIPSLSANDVLAIQRASDEELFYATIGQLDSRFGSTAPVDSVFGRTGAVTAQAGDYTAAQVSALAIANDLSDLASAATARTNLGLGTIATQNAASVTITGGSISGITDLAIADGGTGASTAANARTNLGLGTGDSPTFANVNASTALQVGGANINTGGTLSNVAYKDQANTFTAAQSFDEDLTLTKSSALQTIRSSYSGAPSMRLEFPDAGNTTTDGIYIGSTSAPGDQFRVASRAVIFGSLCNYIKITRSSGTYDLFEFQGGGGDEFARLRLGARNTGPVIEFKSDTDPTGYAKSIIYKCGSGGTTLRHVFRFHNSLTPDNLQFALRTPADGFATYYDRFGSLYADALSIESFASDLSTTEAVVVRSVNSLTATGAINFATYNNATRTFSVSASGSAIIYINDAATNVITDGLTCLHNSSGTPAAGFGAALRFALQSSTTAEQDAAKLKAKWSTATHATRQAQSDWTVYDYNAERTVISIGANGSAGLLGFHAATPVAKQAITGSRAGNAALADLLTKLATLGLITDSTTV